MKNIDKPFYVFAELKEYFKSTPNKNGIWEKIPATMIKKVSESQCIRQAIPSVCNGTYSDAEQWEDPKENTSKKKNVTRHRKF
jgi:hypothetical protein